MRGMYDDAKIQVINKIKPMTKAIRVISATFLPFCGFSDQRISVCHR